jgi:hypothetical protein
MLKLYTNPFSVRRPLPVIDMDEWIANERTRLLLDEDEKIRLLEEHRDQHPVKVGRLIYIAFRGTEFERRTARADLFDLLDRLADTEACRLYHEMVSL